MAIGDAIFHQIILQTCFMFICVLISEAWNVLAVASLHTTHFIPHAVTHLAPDHSHTYSHDSARTAVGSVLC